MLIMTSEEQFLSDRFLATLSEHWLHEDGSNKIDHDVMLKVCPTAMNAEL